MKIVNNIPFPFKSICFGVAFSPNLMENLYEVCRLANLFKAKLELIHVGEKTEDKDRQISEVLKNIPFKPLLQIHWEKGNPTKIITEVCEKLGIDLLILGAMQKENLYKFYMGSIARNLTRNVCCSVWLFLKTSKPSQTHKHIVVNGLENVQTEDTIRKSFYISAAMQNQQLTIVKEIQPEKKIKIKDEKSLQKATLLEKRNREKERQRIEAIIQSVPKELTQGVTIKTQSIFGRRGYSIGHYAEIVRADLLIMNAPKKTSIWDIIFPHDLEYILSELPTNVLIIRPTN